jgi:OOP family OmpA-OmpF porin
VLAQHQPVTGLYVGAGFGANMLDKTDIIPTSADQRALGTLGAEYSWGYAGVLSLGWGYGNGL